MTLGFLADQGAFERARAEWQREHAPSREVWRHALAARGWGEAAERERQGAVRSLPASYDRVPSVWLSRDRRVLAAFGEGGGETPWVFSLEGARPPRAAADWTRVGAGWEAFELALARSAAPGARKRVLATAKPRDPRAFDY